jgi:hypothetical protein
MTAGADQGGDEGSDAAAGAAPGGKDGASRDARGEPRRGRRKPVAEQTLEEKVEDIHHQLVSRRGAELLGMLEIIRSRRKLMWLNFNAGLARGVGFFLGVTMIGALVLGGVALAFNAAAHWLGYSDVTLEQAVTSTVRRFSELRELVEEARTAVAREEQQKQAAAVGTEPMPDAFELDLPGARPKRLGR